MPSLDLSSLLAAKRQIGSIRGLIARWMIERHSLLASMGAPQGVLTAIVLDYRDWMNVAK